VAKACESLDDFHSNSGTYEDVVPWKSNLVQWEGHKRHRTYSKNHSELQKIGMVTLSKQIGAGAPKRCWNDVKAVWDNGKKSMSTAKMEKKVVIYGASRRDSRLTGKDTESTDIFDHWKKTDEVFDLHMEKWAVPVGTLAPTAPSVSFLNYIEQEEADWIKNQSPVANGAKLAAKYKSIRFYDEDEDVHYRFRACIFVWKGRRHGGYVALCDKMPDQDPANDPDGDLDLVGDYEPEEYVINEAFHEMVAAAAQAPGVRLISRDD